MRQNVENEYDAAEKTAADAQRYWCERERAALRVWRVGIMPEMTDRQLRAIAVGLVADDADMLTDKNCEPSPAVDERAPVTAACIIGYGAWRGDRLATVGDVQRFVRGVEAKVEARLDRVVRAELDAADAMEEFYEWAAVGAVDDHIRLRLLAVVRHELRERAWAERLRRSL